MDHPIPLTRGNNMDTKRQETKTEKDSKRSDSSVSLRETVLEEMDSAGNEGASTSKGAQADLAGEGTSAQEIIAGDQVTESDGIDINLDNLGIKEKRLSGAQRKKLRKAEKMAAGTWTKQRPRKPPPGKSGGEAPVGGSKRPISDSSSPATPHPKKARSGAAPTPSYKDATVGIKMAVIDARHPDVLLDQEQADLIQNKLVAAIDAIPFGEASPRFQRFPKFEVGILNITCADPTTRDWLTRTVREMEGLAEGLTLTTVETKDLPKRPKFLVWIPEPVEESVVRNRLRKQNAGLRTEEWLLMSRKVEEKGQTLAYSIDGKSAKALEEADFKPYYCLGRVIFKQIHHKGSTDKPAS